MTRNKIRLLLAISLLPVVLWAQTDIAQRIILIGDAGEINHKQSTVIPDAADKVLPGKTSVFFLGDNVYPRGMGIDGGPDEARGKEILRSQFVPMREKGAAVYFVPGNHDWDRMGKNGLAKMKAQSDFITGVADSLLRMVPENACPGPVAIPLDAQTVVIAYDSEWWLFPYGKDNADADCECHTKEEVIERMEQLFWEHKDKLIIVASHHPFRSYGAHGGSYGLKDHLFPLTALNPNLYLPLPVVGSLYPLLRKSVFMNAEDIPHPKYQELIEKVKGVFEGFPNVIYAAGHEHGLQLIKDDNLHIVSGAGAKHTYIRKGRHSLFANSDQGFVVLDIMADRTAKIYYYQYEKDGQVGLAYDYQKPYVPLARMEQENYGNLLQADSVTVSANSKYDKVSELHRKVFGENYRKEWAAPTVLPVLRMDRISGGLTPLKRGGGMQTVSLRLADSSGSEWVLRSVNKSAESVLPEGLKASFAKELVDDYISGQHPYSALIMPPLANAAGVPHTQPVIGVVAPDSALSVYNKTFTGQLMLLEEREPLGKSDNTEKALRALQKDNDNTIKAKSFFRAMLLDVLVSDWDRHEDQWRWKNTSNKNGEKDYLAVPRDRDQVLKMNQGFVPRLASRSWIMPTFQGFDSVIHSIRYSLYKHRFIFPYPDFRFSRSEWNEMTEDFVHRITDSVIDAAIARLPKSAFDIRGSELALKMKKRRDALPAALNGFYGFINKVVDIRLSDKNEQVTISDGKDRSMEVRVRKINKEGVVTKEIMKQRFTPDVTKEVRVYLGGGNDSVVIGNSSAAVKLRIIGGNGEKYINVQEKGKPVRFYNLRSGATYDGYRERLRTHLSNDSANTAFVPVNLYSRTMPLISAGYNLDDGLQLGAGFRHVHQGGFRKEPYTSSVEYLFTASFTTGAYRSVIKADWIDVIHKADLELNLRAWVPRSTLNFFGEGNSSLYDRSHKITYYRSRFTLADAEALLRWNNSENVVFKAGPAFQYYKMNIQDNENRWITTPGSVQTYDSATLGKDKVFAGVAALYEYDSRNNKIFPVTGGVISLLAKGYTGLNSYSKTFARVEPSLAFYIPLTVSKRIVLANRTGGAFTWGRPAFYQSAFLGGQGNLYGYRQYRFAGNHMLYNNLELRLKIAQTVSYILPGQLGMTFFYDAGKVWADTGDSKTIHQGYGGGFYFAPANLAVIQLMAGHSTEGWYPHFKLGLRF